MKRLCKYLLFSVVLLAGSCDEEDQSTPAPSVFLPLNISSEVKSIGETTSVTVVAAASAGLRSMVVEIDGASFDEVTYSSEFREEYLLEYTVPASAAVGSMIGFTFTVTDVQDRMSNILTYQIQVVEADKFVVTDENLAGNMGTKVKQISALPGTDAAIINSDLTLDATQPWMLNGPVLVEEGVTLTIEAGTLIYAKVLTTGSSFLAVQPGGQISATGTPDEPIVFTSERSATDNAIKGDWGGLLLLGAGQTNLTGDDLVLPVAGAFGGTEDDQSSGTLSYVRVEYGGKDSDAAIILNSVGSGTQIDHIQSFSSAAAGIQLFGGAVNVRHAVVVGALDHSFNCRHGWRGLGQYWVAQAFPNKEDPRALEVRNNSDDFDALPRTAPVISNITLIGPGEATKNEKPEKNNRGLRMREGASGQFHNFLVTQFPDDAVRLDNDADPGIVVTHGHSWNNDDNFAKSAADLFANPANNLFDTPAGTIDVNQWTGSTSTAALEASTLGEWFDAVSFIGAIENDANDWTAAGEWCKNEDGSVR